MNDSQEFVTLKELRRTISALEKIATQFETISREQFTHYVPATMRGRTKLVEDKISLAINEVKVTVERLKSRLKELEKEVYDYDGGVLQATFTHKRSRYRFIVNKPNKHCDDPHLDNLQWQALLHLFGKETVDIDAIRTESKYAVAVMHKYGHIIERWIPPATPTETKI